MKKIFLLLLLTVFSVGTLSAQNTNTWQQEDGEFIETTKPIFLFDEESYDFGDMVEGEKYEYTFKFKNIGAEPMILKNVKASCGCTTPSWPREPIMPGETNEINVIFNSKGKRGSINKAITITSNAVEPVKRIFIKGKIPMPAPTPVKQAEEAPVDEAKPIMEEDNNRK